MADTTKKQFMTVVATTSDRIKDLVIKDGQLIFCHDVGRIAFDYKGKRKIYNQIIELETEQERLDLDEPENGKYYFILETAVLWRYYNEWLPITKEPDEILFIGDGDFPELGQPKTLYVNKTDGDEYISVWDEELGKYKIVANRTYSITEDDVIDLFHN